MKNLISSLFVILTILTTPFASGAETPTVRFYLSCQEVGAQMFDAIVVNIDQYITAEASQLKASVYHRVEQGTILVNRENVRESQDERPGAPKEFIGTSVHLSVKTTVTPDRKGFPATFEMRSEQDAVKIEMSCKFVR